MTTILTNTNGVTERTEIKNVKFVEYDKDPILFKDDRCAVLFAVSKANFVTAKASE